MFPANRLIKPTKKRKVNHLFKQDSSLDLSLVKGMDRIEQVNTKTDEREAGGEEGRYQ
jgi:hypothetical protein